MARVALSLLGLVLVAGCGGAATRDEPGAWKLPLPASLPSLTKQLPAREVLPDAPLPRVEPDRDALRFSHDGALLALLTPDRVELRDGATGALRARWGLGERPQMMQVGGLAMAWAPDDHRLAVAVDDRLLVIDVSTGAIVELGPRPSFERAGFRGIVMGPITWSPDGARVLVGTENGGLVWDLARRAITAVAAGSVASWSPDGTRLIAAEPSSGDVEIVDAASGRALHRWRGDKVGFAHAAAWSPDGARLAIGTETGRVILFDASTFRELARSRMFPGYVTALAWRPDGHALALGLGGTRSDENPRPMRDKILKYLGGSSRGGDTLDGPYAIEWDPATQAERPTARRGEVGELVWHDALVVVRPADESFDLDAGGARIAGGGTVADDGRTTLERILPGVDQSTAGLTRGGQSTRVPVAGDAQETEAFTFSAWSGASVVWRDGGHAALLDLARGEATPLDGGYPGGATPFAFDEHHLAWLSWNDPAAHVLDLATHKARAYTSRGAASVHDASLAPRGDLLAVIADSATKEQPSQLVVWKLGGARPLAQVATGAVRVLGWSPDGKRVALMVPVPKSNDEELHVYAATTGKQLWSVPLPSSAMPGDIAWSAHDEIVFPVGGYDQPPHARVFDGATGAPVMDVPGALLAGWSPDGNRLAFYGTPAPCVWSRDTRRCDRTLAVKEPAEVRSAAWSSDGAFLTVRHINAPTVEVLDAATGALVRTIPVARDRNLQQLGITWWVTPTVLAITGPTLRLISVRDGATLTAVRSGAAGDLHFVALDEAGHCDGDPASLATLRVRDGADLRSAALRSIAELPDVRAPGLVASFIAAHRR